MRVMSLSQVRWLFSLLNEQWRRKRFSDNLIVEFRIARERRLRIYVAGFILEDQCRSLCARQFWCPFPANFFWVVASRGVSARLLYLGNGIFSSLASLSHARERRHYLFTPVRTVSCGDTSWQTPGGVISAADSSHPTMSNWCMTAATGSHVQRRDRV